MSPSERNGSSTESPTAQLPRSFGCGLLIGFLLFVSAAVATMLAPGPRIAPLADVALPAQTPSTARPVTIELTTHCTWRVPGWWIAQGMGHRLRPLAFRSARVAHPNGTVAFGTGPVCAPGRPDCDCVLPRRLGGLSRAPGARLRADTPPFALRLVVLPTMRPWHTGGIAAVPASVPVVAGGTERAGATRGPRRARLGYIDPVDPDDRVETIEWARYESLGATRAFDVFGDGSVVAVPLRGSAWEEVALWVDDGHGPARLLVGDAIRHRDQLAPLRPGPVWSALYLERNRMQLYTTLRLLGSVAERGVEVVPLFDAESDPSR
jgi:hypothetical protein